MFLFKVPTEQYCVGAAVGKQFASFWNPGTPEPPKLENMDYMSTDFKSYHVTNIEQHLATVQQSNLQVDLRKQVLDAEFFVTTGETVPA